MQPMKDARPEASMENEGAKTSQEIGFIDKGA